jgi:hypothetical protein
MINESELMKIGDKYYKLVDVQQVFDARIKEVPLDEIEFNEIIEETTEAA